MTWPYLVRLREAAHVANNPAGALAKRVITANLNHLANSHGQTLVNWSVADGGGVTRATPGGTVYLWQSAPMPLRLRSDGSAFPWRVRLRGRRVSGSATITFYAGVESVGMDQETFATSSSSSAWLAATGDNLLTINADRAAALRGNVAAPIDLGGATVAYPEVMARVYVYAEAVGANTVELTGVHVTEFVGA